MFPLRSIQSLLASAARRLSRQVPAKLCGLVAAACLCLCGGWQNGMAQQQDGLAQHQNGLAQENDLAQENGLAQQRQSGMLQRPAPMAAIAYPPEALLSDSALAVLAALPPKPIRIDFDANVICYGDSLVLEALHTDYGPIANLRCEWFYNGQPVAAEPNQTRIVFFPPSNNIRIWFKLYDADRLIGADTMTVYVTDPPTGYTMLHDTICLGDEATVGVQGAVGGSAGQYWDWVTTGTTQFINDRPLVSTDYRVYFSQYPIKEYGYKNRCYTTDTAHVEVLTEPAISITGDSAVCTGNDAIVELSGASHIQWYDGSTEPVYRLHNVQNDVVLQVRATDRFGCRGLRTWKISAVERPTGVLDASADSLCLGEEVSVWIAYMNADSAVWFNKAQTDTITFIPKQSMEIYADLYIGKRGGCSNRIYKPLHVEHCLKVHFPTGFKLDGLSPEYKPIGLMEPNKSYYFAIYNRNGMRLFETRDLNVGWDGKYKGEWVHPGVYVYYYKETFDRFTTERKGTVTVVK